MDCPGFIFMAVNEPSENYPRVLLCGNTVVRASVRCVAAGDVEEIGDRSGELGNSSSVDTH